MGPRVAVDPFASLQRTFMRGHMLSHTPLRAAGPSNSLLGEWSYGIPRCQAIRPAQDRPAFALKVARANFRAITIANSAPTFATMIAAMERSGQPLARISWA